MSDIGWVDFSSTDRERVSQVLAMLKEPGTLDELGIGQVRDAFADNLFPGFSTIQTRAKYSIIVPRILRDFQELPKQERNRKKLDIYLKEQEDDIAKLLVERHKNELSKTLGIIGATKIDKGGVARRPSSVYWNGLRQFGIIQTQLSLAEFCRAYGELGERYTSASSNDDGSDDSDAIEQIQTVHIPSGNGNWLEELSIHLSVLEAKFLRDKIRHATTIQHSIPAQLFNTGLLEDALDENLKTFAALSDWLHSKDEISIDCRRQSDLARKFSSIMKGAHLRFNCIIADRLGHEKRLGDLESSYQKWRDYVIGSQLFHDEILQELLAAVQRQNPKIHSRAVKFVKEWCLANIHKWSKEQLDELIVDQAVHNKKNRSVLKKQLPPDTGWVGMDVLDYRWPQAQIILADIVRGLKC